MSLHFPHQDSIVTSMNHLIKAKSTIATWVSTPGRVMSTNHPFPYSPLPTTTPLTDAFSNQTWKDIVGTLHNGGNWLSSLCKSCLRLELEVHGAGYQEENRRYNVEVNKYNLEPARTGTDRYLLCQV